MTVAVYLPLAVSVVLAVCAPWLAVRLQPAAGAWTLTVVAATAGLTTTWTLALLAATLFDELPSAGPRIGLGMPVQDLVAGAAAAMLMVGGCRLLTATRSRWRLHRRLRSVCASVGDGELVVLPQPWPDAFVVPDRPGRVVVTEGMLRALSAPQRQVLLAHERAHLRGGHHRFAAVVQAAAAVNPVLVPVRRAVAFACERWADEQAARVVGDRRLAARSLAAAALATIAPVAGADTAGAGTSAWAFHRLRVADRVAALQRPPQSQRWLPAMATLLLCAALVVAEFDATGDFVGLVAGLLAG